MKKSALLLVLATLGLAACTPTATLTAPDGFAEIDGEESYGYRATTAAGVVVAVRTEKNDPRGNLAFWAGALDHKLVKLGYQGAGKPERVVTEAGVEGRRLKYTTQRGGRPHGYWVTVFVRGDELVIVEAGGDAEFFDETTEKQIDAAIRSMRLG